FPHEICPVDGVVVDGSRKMNEAYLTGEPFEIEKMPGSQVISGAINGDTALNIRAEKLVVNSRFARIMRVMQDAEQHRPHTRRLADKLGAWYKILETLKAGGRIEQLETVRVTKTGKRIDVSLSISPIKDSSGEIVGCSGIARDITERKRTEEALH